MDVLFPYLLAILVVVVSLGAFVLPDYLLEKQRTRSVKAIARNLGLAIDTSNEFEFLESLNESALYSLGNTQNLCNLLRGTYQEHDVCVFDYEYMLGSSSTGRLWRTSVVCIQLSTGALPEFSLWPRQEGNRQNPINSAADIPFEDYPFFSHQYRVAGQAQEAIKACLNDVAVKSYERHLGLHTEVLGDRLLFYRRAQRFTPKELPDFLNEAFDIVMLLQGQPIYKQDF